MDHVVPKRTKKKNVQLGKRLLVDGILKMSMIGHGWSHLAVNVRAGMVQHVMVNGILLRAVKGLDTFVVDHSFGMVNMLSLLLTA